MHTAEFAKPLLLYNRALTLRQLKLDAKALVDLDEIVANHPKYVDAHRLRASIYKDMGLLDKTAELEAIIRVLERQEN